VSDITDVDGRSFVDARATRRRIRRIHSFIRVGAALGPPGHDDPSLLPTKHAHNI
jgi:hypothetical protein